MTWSLETSVLTVGLLVLTTGCRWWDMQNQPRMKSYRASSMFADGTSAQLPPAGTVPHTPDLEERVRLETAGASGQLTGQFPIAVTRSVLERGRQRYEIFCSPCHGLTGDGNGPVAQRGFFPQIPPLQQDRLRREPEGYLFTVISNGFNAMPSYGAQIPPADRWAIVAYIRALQVSEHPEDEDEVLHGQP